MRTVLAHPCRRGDSRGIYLWAKAVWKITAHDTSYTIGLFVRRGLLDDPDEGTRRLQP